MKQKNIRLFIMFATCFIFVFTIAVVNENKIQVIETSSALSLSNEKIGWGIKRNDKHNQPDLGAENKRLIDKYNGMAMGNNEEKNLGVGLCQTQKNPADV